MSDILTSSGQRVIEQTLGDLTRAPVPTAHTASVLLGIRSQDVITANMLERQRKRFSMQCEFDALTNITISC